jgi:hypothetical protein
LGSRILNPRFNFPGSTVSNKTNKNPSKGFLKVKTLPCSSSSPPSVAHVLSSRTTASSIGKISSPFFSNPQKPTSSNPKTSNEELTSNSKTFPEVTNFNAQNQTPLQEFLKRNCKSGNSTLNEATHFFDHMINMNPTPPIASFNLLLGSPAKKKLYFDVILLCKRMNQWGC